VILHGRSAKVLDRLYQELKERGPEPAVAVLDFERAQGDEYQHLTAQIEERYGRLDGLLHNAGMLGDRSPIEHYDIGLWQRVMHVNVNAPFILTRCLLPLLRASGDGSLVFTTSGVGHYVKPFWGAYSASKFATESLALMLAEELEGTTVRVNLVNPGPARTSMRRRAYPGEDPATLPTPESLTPAYLYLLGTDSAPLTGQRIECQG
jgi:NAD(P)-dependent dehydrogenase (short-subunit alcohol dehydrogenase family)